MFFSKAIIALTTAAVAVATPLARDAQCKLTVTPAHSADITALRASFNNGKSASLCTADRYLYFLSIAVSHAVEAHWPLGLDNVRITLHSILFLSLTAY